MPVTLNAAAVATVGFSETDTVQNKGRMKMSENVKIFGKNT
jgi:hypothetical protein